jgi:hypothetical protein
MNPDQFNLLSGIGNLHPDNLSGLDNTPASDLSLSSVDSSGNMLLPEGMMAGGAILSAFGDIMSGNESAAADEYNAQLALEQGQFEVQKLGEEETGTLSTQHAMYAKAGVTMSGSPLDVATSTATQFEMSKRIAMYNAASQANADRNAAAAAKSKGEFGAAGSLLQGAEGLGMLAMLA